MPKPNSERFRINVDLGERGNSILEDVRASDQAREVFGKVPTVSELIRYALNRVAYCLGVYGFTNDGKATFEDYGKCTQTSKTS